jgi:diacylglycerol kinase family enzyme
LRVPIIVNPTAGGGRLLRRRLALDAASRAVDLELVWWLTEGPGHATELARRAADQGFPMLLAFGGDGTYNEAAVGLHGSRTSLGVLPGGTTSVLAYELAIPRPAERALIALAAGRDRSMNVARTDGGRLVLLMLSAGPDAVVLHRLRPGLKRLGGRVGVGVQAVLEVLRPRPFPALRVTAGGRVRDAGWIVIGNSRCYAGPFHATPGADPFAPNLEVVLQQRTGRLAAARFAIGIATGSHIRLPTVRRTAADRVRVEPTPASPEVPFQVDGDVAGLLPVEVSVDPEPLRVRVPGA